VGFISTEPTNLEKHLQRLIQVNGVNIDEQRSFIHPQEKSIDFESIFWQQQLKAASLK